MKPIFKKHLYLRVIKFNSDKSSTITYHKSIDYHPSFLINDNHVFLSNGFRTILVTDKAAETINPLDFKSQFSVNDFTSAIESKIVRETFASIEKKGLDLTTLLLIGNIIASLAIAYLVMKGNGMI